MPPRSGVRAPIQLLVEGADVKYFFIHLLGHMGINNVEVQGDVEWRGHARFYREAPDLLRSLGLSSIDEGDIAAFNRVRAAILEHLDPSDVEVSSFGGVAELRGFLRAVWNSPGAQSTIQALGIVRDAEASSSDAFKSARDAIDALRLTPPDCPTQIVGEKPRIGILILPPGKPKGMLEDVCLDAVQDDPAMPCVREYIECVKRSVPNWRVQYRKKASVQAFLASRPEPGLKLGEGAKLGYWNWSHEAYRPIKQFIQDLTGP